MSRIVGWARDAVRALFEPRDAGDFALCYALLLLGGYGMPWPFLAVVAAFNAYLLYGSLQGLGRLREVHHGYLGLALCCTPWPWLRAIGVVLLVDDTQFQHVPQFLARLRLQTPRPDDTPIHALGAWLLQRWLDLVWHRPHVREAHDRLRALAAPPATAPAGEADPTPEYDRQTLAMCAEEYDKRGYAAMKAHDREAGYALHGCAAAIRRVLARTAPAPAPGAADARAREDAATLDDVRRAMQVWNGWPADHDPGELWLTHDDSARAMQRVLEADRAARRAAGATEARG